MILILPLLDTVDRTMICTVVVGWREDEEEEEREGEVEGRIHITSRVTLPGLL